MTLEPGDLILVQYPFTDLTGTKRRPAIVLSRREYHESSDDVLACAVTSNLKDSLHSVLLDTNRMREGRLQRPSRAKVAKCFTLANSLIVRKMGRISDADLDRIRGELRVLLSL